MSLKRILFISLFTAVFTTVFIHLAGATNRPATVANITLSIAIQATVMFLGQWGTEKLTSRYLKRKQNA